MKHELIAKERGFVCLLCGWQWAIKPVSDCPGVIRYTWSNKPSDLYTDNSLLAEGLEPPPSTHRRGVIWSVRESIYYDLYHIQDAKPQPDAIETPVNEALQAYCGLCGALITAEGGEVPQLLCNSCLATAHQEAIEWARDILARDMLILSLSIASNDEPEIIEIAAINTHDELLMNTLLSTEIPITAESLALYGLTNRDLAEAPTFADIYSQLEQTIGDSTLLCEQAKFIQAVVAFNTQRYALAPLKINALSVIEGVAAYLGRWDKHQKAFSLASLGVAIELFGLEITDLREARHRCQAILALLKAIAG